MTLFETLPQFTLFVLFFMVGFVTRFFARLAMFLFGVAFHTVGTKLRFACQKIVANAKKAFQKQIERRVLTKQCREVRPKKNGKLAKQKQGEAFSVTAKQKHGEKVRPKQIGKLAKQKHGDAFELIYFAGLGILTLKVFSKLEFVDFFWFIPLAVILGVVCNDYLTKEVFAKRKKV